MVSIHQHHDSEELLRYYKEHFDTEASFTLAPGNWFGTGADLLCLEGAVTRKTFKRLCGNTHPILIGRLTQRRSPNARPACDFILSAPKSVSIMALVLHDKRIREAHALAVSETLKEIEKFAQVRVRRNDADHDRVTGNIVGARFEHHTSRANDPQLHTHCVIFNATFDDEEGVWKALQAGEMVRRSRLGTEIYRAILIHKLHRIGYPTKRTSKGFEIIGVPQEVIKTFSKRHSEIDQIEERFGASGNPRLRKAIARNYRAPKVRTKCVEELQADWARQLAPPQLAELGALKAAAMIPVKLSSLSVSEALDLAARHLFERRSVVSLIELWCETLVVGDGRLGLSEIQEALGSAKDLVVRGGMVTCREAILSEVRIVSFVNDGTGKMAPLAASFAPGCHLSSEQHQAVTDILKSRNRVIELTGPAGAGKSSVLGEVRRGIIASGKRLVACAPTKKAVSVLRDGGFPTAITLQRLLHDVGYQNAAKEGIILVDEAGLASIRQIDELFKIATAQKCHVLLSGDSDQHKSIEAGDALRILERESRLDRIEIRTIYRQKEEGYRTAVALIKQGHPEAAFHYFNFYGHIHQLADEERYQMLAQQFVSLQESGKSTLVVCATHRESDLVSEAIRGELKAKKRIAPENHIIETLCPLYLTEAHRQQCRNYLPGQVIVLHRQMKSFERGTRLVVLEINRDQIKAQLPEGEPILLDPKKIAKYCGVYELRNMTVSQGEELILTQSGTSRNRKPLIAGERVKIDSIEFGSIRLTDGRLINVNYGHFGLAYASTSQRSQGCTVDHVLVAIDSQSARSAASWETFYVAASRGRECCTFYTDDIELLRKAFCRSGERLSAFELFGNRKD